MHPFSAYYNLADRSSKMKILTKYIGVNSVALKFFIFLLFLADNAISENCETWTSSKGIFSRISYNSKYVYFTPDSSKDFNKGSWEDAKKVCKEQEMDIASFTSQKDAQNVENFFKKNKLCEESRDVPKRSFWLGMTDTAKEGEWIDVTTDKEITFQNFYQFEPINVPKLSALLLGPEQPAIERDDYGNYAYVKCTGDNRIAMFESHKGGSAGSLCQFQASKKCFEDSVETSRNNRIDDKLKPIGKTSKRSYFIGLKQKSQNEAFSYCLSYQSKLLDLDPRSDIDDEEVNKLLKFLLKWKHNNELPLWAHSFWTSGRHKNFKKDKEFKWESTDNKFSENETAINLKFAEDEYHETHKTYDTFGNGEFSCISIAPFKTSGFANGKGDEFLGLVRSVCTVPHWTVCYGKPDYVPPDEPDGSVTLRPKPDPVTDESEESNPGTDGPDPKPDTDGPDPNPGGGGGSGDGGNDPEGIEMWQWYLTAV